MFRLLRIFQLGSFGKNTYSYREPTPTIPRIDGGDATPKVARRASRAGASECNPQPNPVRRWPLPPAIVGRVPPHAASVPTSQLLFQRTVIIIPPPPRRVQQKYRFSISGISEFVGLGAESDGAECSTGCTRRAADSPAAQTPQLPSCGNPQRIRVDVVGRDA
jgi:hypothetical protein